MALFIGAFVQTLAASLHLFVLVACYQSFKDDQVYLLGLGHSFAPHCDCQGVAFQRERAGMVRVHRGRRYRRVFAGASIQETRLNNTLGDIVFVCGLVGWPQFNPGNDPKKRSSTTRS